jgi:hypothetical protein
MIDANYVYAIFKKCGLQILNHLKNLLKNWGIAASELLPKSTLLVKNLLEKLQDIDI